MTERRGVDERLRATFCALHRGRVEIIAVAAALALCAAACGIASGTDAPASSSPTVTASSAFWEHWGDGRAELDAYALTTMRYGAPREGHAVLIYVTEPVDSRTWIKDDRGEVPSEFRVNVLKLNHVIKFRTGVYPYSVMTSVFAPVDGRFPVRFSPAKITFTAQEWCGHVYQRVLPRADGFDNEIRSYFSSEGERGEATPAPAGALYEDALPIQLRELDGPFQEGKDWAGSLVPGLWAARKAHEPLRAVPATIRRSEAERDGVPVTRFVVAYGDSSRTFDVEKAFPRRILGWKGPDGEEARLLGSARLPYWKLNGPGDESYLREIGLDPAAPSR